MLKEKDNSSIEQFESIAFFELFQMLRSFF